MFRVAILAATSRELAPIRSALEPFGTAHRDHRGPFHWETVRTDQLEIHVIETGIGPVLASNAASITVSCLLPHAMIATGYAGALGPEGVGALIVATEVHDWTKERGHAPETTDTLMQEAAKAAARRAGLGWSQGAVLTVARVAWRATEKQTLSEASGALAVDMETAAISKVAKAAGIPFVAVRAISDKVGEDLPLDFSRCFGPFGLVHAIIEIMRHPSILKGLYRMKRQADVASESLGGFFRMFLEGLVALQLSMESSSSLTRRALS
jgi:adenosylhomocysteine nucleosidase